MAGVRAAHRCRVSLNPLSCAETLSKIIVADEKKASECPWKRTTWLSLVFASSFRDRDSPSRCDKMIAERAVIV